MQAADRRFTRPAMLRCHPRPIAMKTPHRIVPKALVELLCLLLLSATSLWAANDTKHKILVAADIHFNPMADASLVPELVRAEPTQWEAILNQSKPHSFSPYGQDTNWWLLESSLDQMRKTLPRPAVFLILGDVLAHRYPELFRSTAHDNDLGQYRAFVLKTVQFLALQLGKRWPDTQILITPGNDDDDCGDYSIEAGGAFLSDTAPILRQLARADDNAATNWKASGSYSLMLAGVPGVRIITLNSAFFSEKYEPRSFADSCEEIQSTAPSQEFAWLEQTLSDAKQAHQKVWLMFHIPPGIDGFASTHGHNGSCAANIVPLWIPEWTVKFVSSLIGYQDTVTASFAAHTHTDNFQVIREGQTPVQFVLVDPPISPIYGQNPAFRVIKIEGTEVRDITTYYLTNLTTAGASQAARWKEEYAFSREWKIKQVHAASLSKVYDQIVSSDAARAQWLRLYNVSSPAAKVSPDTVHGLYCTIENQGVGAYRKCACVAVPQ